MPPRFLKKPEANIVLLRRIILSGSVQGVGCRSFVCRIANSLSLVGTVKNLPDGTVEIVAEGEEERLGEFLRRLKTRSPSGIDVEKAEVAMEKKMASRTFASFSIEY